MRKMLVGLALLCGACGDDSAPAVIDAATFDAPTPDAGGAPADAAPPDATPPDAMPLNPSTCPATYGPSTIINTFTLAEDESEAFDLDGDGTGDNVLAPTAAIINGSFQDSLETGGFRLISELRELDDPLLLSDPAVVLATFAAVDQDSPMNAMDDFSGMEPFWFSQDSVTPADCTPHALLPTTIAVGTMTGEIDTMPVPISGFGVVEVERLHLEANVMPAATGFTSSSGRLGGAIPTCALQQGTETPVGENYLHALAGILDIQPDIDLDGDGLEVINGNSLGIQSCTDGDGTVVDGSTCGCDPRIVDGYSVLFHYTSVGASLTGPAPTP